VRPLAYVSRLPSWLDSIAKEENVRVGVGSTRAPLIGVAVFMLLTAGCGGDAGGGNVVATINVTASDAGFDPATVNLDKPGMYTFHYTNKGTRPYAVDVEGNGVDTDGDVVQPGQSGNVQVDLNKAGTYEMHSQTDNTDRSHELHGKVVVKG
jgi:plastocyanin